MPRTPPKNSSRFKPGQSGNKKGGSTKVRTRTAVKRLFKNKLNGRVVSPDDIALMLSQIVLGLLPDVEEIKNAPDTVSHQAYAAKLWQHGYKNNDLSVFKAFTEMLIGKPKERTSMELTGKDGSAIQVATRDELLARAMALRAQVDSLGDE